MCLDNLKINQRSYYNLPNSAFWGWLSIESQPQNPEFKNNPESFHPCNKTEITLWKRLNEMPVAIGSEWPKIQHLCRTSCKGLSLAFVLYSGHNYYLSKQSRSKSATLRMENKGAFPESDQCLWISVLHDAVALHDRESLYFMMLLLYMIGNLFASRCNYFIHVCMTGNPLTSWCNYFIHVCITVNPFTSWCNYFIQVCITGNPFTTWCNYFTWQGIPLLHDAITFHDRESP